MTAMTAMNYLTSVVRLMDICESELLFGTLPIAKTRRQYIKRAWMKHSVVEEHIISKYNCIVYLVNGKRHRTDGNPADVHTTVTKFWYIDNKSHRVGGPSNIFVCGGKEWYANDKRHRIGGPAIVCAGGKYWCINGKLHRVDGPAIIRADGDKEWHINGSELMNFDFLFLLITTPQ